MEDTLIFIILFSPIVLGTLCGGISCIIDSLCAPKNKYTKMCKDLEVTKENLIKEYEDLKQTYMLKEKKQFEEKEQVFNGILEDKKQSCPTLAQVFADYEYIMAHKASNYLAHKSHPAYKAADTVRDYGQRNKYLVRQNKELEYQLNFLKNLFPWIDEFTEVDVDTAVEYTSDRKQYDESNENDEYSHIKQWLSPEEYKNLSNVEKYQLALDRYRKRKNKTKWQIGIEYERYIGYTFEKKSYTVEYRGALDGLQDMGRDLIASRKDIKIVIQCKYWNSNKTIHEKHIFQLFGTAILLKLEKKDSKIKPLFVTSATLSDTARKVAKELKISVWENIPMSYDYPCIKCNINQSSGEKIYHLPFDQQYDRVIIRPALGEKYVYTVQEAEDLGFRRAHRWKGSASQ